MSDLYFSCPVCGEDVPRKAKSCPSCGACEMSGWSEDSYLDGIDLPDEDYTDGSQLEQPAKRGGLQWLWAVVAIVLIILTLLSLTRPGW